MNTKSLAIGAAVAAIVGFFWWLPEPESNARLEATQSTPAKESQVIKDKIIFDGERWLTDADIVFGAGKIIAIGTDVADKYPQAKMIETDAGFIIPGLIDAHTHTWGNALKDAVRFGVTAELDMFTNNQYAQQARGAREQVNSNTQLADFYSAGTLITSPKGHGTEYGFEIPTISAPSEADSVVAARIAEGSDYIKIVYDATAHRMPSIDQATLEAVIKAAKQQGKLAVVHIDNITSAEHAIAAGADGLVHSFIEAGQMQALTQAMRNSQSFVIPTLSVLASVTGQVDNETLLTDFAGSDLQPERFAAQLKQKFVTKANDAAFNQALANVGKFHQAGVKVLAGTDAPNPGIAHGISMHQELEYLVRAGLSIDQALQAATKHPAEAFNLELRGQLQAGYRADFVLLNKDPRQSITHTRAIAGVYKNGFAIEPINEANAQVANQPIALGAFDKDLQSSLGFDWLITTDEMFQGSSIAALELVNRDGTSSLKVTGKIGQGFPYPWAGVFLPFSAERDQGIDISALTRVAFASQGTAGNYRVLLFSTHQPMRPIELNFTMKNQRQTSEVAFTSIDKNLLKSVSGMAIVAGKGQDKFEFYLDDIWLK